MSKARLVITAIVLEGRSQAAVAREYGLSKGWVSKLVARYQREGEAAFESKPKHPKTSPVALTAGTVTLIEALRNELHASGLHAGADTIARIIDQHTGSLLRQLTLDPTHDYQRTGRPLGPPKRKPLNPRRRFREFPIS